MIRRLSHNPLSRLTPRRRFFYAPSNQGIATKCRGYIAKPSFYTYFQVDRRCPNELIRLFLYADKRLILGMGLRPPRGFQEMLKVLNYSIMSDLTHFDADGNARMVDVGDKSVTRRMAKAQGLIRMRPSTAELIKDGAIEKGDVLNIARIAGISGSKWTPHLIPMCHPIAVESVDIEFAWSERPSSNLAELAVSCTVGSTGRTGVEMEALTAVSIAALTVYDMCKSVDRELEIASVHLLEKSGGKSGHFVRQDLPTED